MSIVLNDPTIRSIVWHSGIVKCSLRCRMNEWRMSVINMQILCNVFRAPTTIGVEKKLGCCRISDFWHTLKCEVNEWSVDANRTLSFETENYSRIGKERRALLWSTASFVIHYIRSHSILSLSLYPNPHLPPLRRGSPCPTGSTSVHVMRIIVPQNYIENENLNGWAKSLA